MSLVFAKEPFLLHLLAHSTSISALDAVKQLMDNGSHDVNEREPTDNMSPLHVAASWDNLAMCQLLVHYGADINAVDIDKRRPIDLASGRTKKFLKKLLRKNKGRRLKRFLSFLFSSRQKSIPLAIEEKSFSTSVSNNPLSLTPSSKLTNQRSCPALLPFSNSIMGAVHSNQNSLQEEDDKESKNSTYGTAPSNFDYKNSLNSCCCPFSMKPIVVNEIDFISLDNTANSTQNNLKPEIEDSKISIASYSTAINLNNNRNDFVEKFDSTETLNEKSKTPQNVEVDVVESELKEKISKLGIDELRKTLLEHNVPVGPINERNRYIYERRLAKLTMDISQGVDIGENRYSVPLQKVIHDDENNTNHTKNMGKAEEMAIRAEYFPPTSTAVRREIDYFCYLLIDPSMIFDPAICTIREFVNAIFYIGKGRRGRPLQHLIDAAKCRKFVTDPSYKCMDKLQKILDLWDNGHGVISLHVSQNIHSAEALVREGSMIDAIGIENLTNIRRGNFVGLAATWTHLQIAGFGASLLRKAHVVFRHERCRPIFEADANIMLESWKPYYNPNKKVVVPS